MFEGAPRDARIVVVGVCMEADRSEPMLGIMKELNVQYVLGYTPDEFAYSLRLIAEGEVDAASLVTATVGVDGVAQAFDDLANPEAPHQDHRRAVATNVDSSCQAKREPGPIRRGRYCLGALVRRLSLNNERLVVMGRRARKARDDGPHTGSAIEYFTWLSAKLDSIEAMPSSRVSLFFRNAS